MKGKVVFMGTPTFAVPSLKALEEKGFSIVGVVTQPDRKRGRGKKTAPTPVKEAALKMGLPVFQPLDPNATAFLQQLKRLSPDVVITVAFGHLLKEQLLTLPSEGCLNVHASLLPKYRGAAPIAWAILKGETVTGVTIMKMDAGLDTGPILAQRETPIHPHDTTETLSERLSKIGADLLVETLEKWLNKEIIPSPQNQSLATYAPPLQKKDGKIDWTKPALEIERQIRAMTPWPGAFTTIDNKNLKIFRAEVTKIQKDLRPGQALVTDNEWLTATGSGALRVLEIQLEGKKRQNIQTFLKGFKKRGTITLQ